MTQGLLFTPISLGAIALPHRIAMTLPASETAPGRINDRIGTQLVLEASGMRVLHLRLVPGQTLPLVSGPQRQQRNRARFDQCGRNRTRLRDGRVQRSCYEVIIRKYRINNSETDILSK